MAIMMVIIMSKNVGKLFEEDFIKSVPNNVFHFRFKDLPYFLTRNSKYEISNNPADFILFYNYLLVLELKSTNNTSYPFSNTRENQVKGLKKYSEKDKVICGFIINMRRFNETYFINIDDYIYLKNESDRKSISIKDLRLFGIRISQEVKRTRYTYDIKNFLEKICNIQSNVL